MASRMERYYKDELTTPARSSKNKSLYEQIENLENYTNIEGVATIEKTNEIDISKVREMIKNRENYKKQKQLKAILEEEKEKLEEEPEEIYEPKSYDIKDLLSKMEENVETEDNRRLTKDQYEVLKSLNTKKTKKYDIKQEEEELKELLQTISGSKALNNLANSTNGNESDEDVGLLDDLKSDTVVGDASSIKKILDEEKEKTQEMTNTEIDKSFYTSSFGFTQRDFEELKNMNQNIKKSNKYIIVLLVVIICIVIIGVLFFIFNR